MIIVDAETPKSCGGCKASGTDVCTKWMDMSAINGIGHNRHPDCPIKGEYQERDQTREVLLKLLDMCREVDELRIVIGSCIDEVWIEIYRGNNRNRIVIERGKIEGYVDCEELLKTAIELCDKSMSEYEERKRK